MAGARPGGAVGRLTALLDGSKRGRHFSKIAPRLLAVAGRAVGVFSVQGGP